MDFIKNGTHGVYRVPVGAVLYLLPSPTSSAQATCSASSQGGPWLANGAPVACGPFVQVVDITVECLTGHCGVDVIATGAGGAVQVTANLTITPLNAALYNGQVLEWTGAFFVTLSQWLPAGFGFAGIPPAAGNASIVSDGTVLMQNGTGATATTTITRAAATNAMFAVQQRGSAQNTYIVAGS